MLRLRRARRLLDPDEEPKTLGGAAPPATLPGAPARESVTEHTTLRLDASRTKETTPVDRR